VAQPSAVVDHRGHLPPVTSWQDGGRPNQRTRGRRACALQLGGGGQRDGNRARSTARKPNRGEVAAGGLGQQRDRRPDGVDVGQRGDGERDLDATAAPGGRHGGRAQEEGDVVTGAVPVERDGADERAYPFGAQHERGVVQPDGVRVLLGRFAAVRRPKVSTFTDHG
jgi:hypothetical protein